MSRQQPHAKLASLHISKVAPTGAGLFATRRSVSQQQARGLLATRACVGCAMSLLIAATSLTVFAQSSGGEFEIINSTIDNGGGRSTGGPFTLTGSIGQPDASSQRASGGEFQLNGGFWAKGVATSNDELMFADGFESL